MKRAFLVLAMLVTGTSVLTAQTVSARVGGELTGFQNQTLTVPIVVDMTAAAGAKLGSYTARLQWDPAVLDWNGDPVIGDFPAPQVNTDSVGQGIATFGAIAPIGASGIVTLAGVRLRVLGSASGSTLVLSFSDLSAAGTFANLLPVTVTNGSFCLAKGRWGDLDQDGVANSRDALAILSKVVGLDVSVDAFDMTLGDVDGDTKINSRDALIILSYAVGLEIPGQRVLLAAPSGSCGTGSAHQVAVFPANASLVPDQQLQLIVRGVDSAGHPVSLTGANWRSSDNLIAGVDPNGTVLPRLPGVVTMTATVGPGLKAQATITVVARRPNWYVDIHAIGAPVQLGTATFPFEHPTRAYDLLQEGDTVRVAPGTYVFDGNGTLNAGAVIIGGTSGDTTTRPLFLDVNSDYGLWLRGGLSTLVRNVVFKNFDRAVSLSGVHNFAMEDVRISATNASEGIDGGNGPMDTVRIDRSAFLATDSSGTGIDICCDRVGLVLIRDSKIKYWDEGAYLYEVDSTAVVRSEISANYDYGLEVSQESNVNPALSISHSRIERNWLAGVYLDYGRRFVLDSSVVRATDDDGLEIYSKNVPLQVYFHGDSIYQEGNAEDYEWLDGRTFDTLAIDRLVVRYPADTSFYAYSDITANSALVTNSKFLNIGSTTEPFAFYGQKIAVNNVTMTGCAVSGCDNGYGLELNSSGTTLDAEIRNSTFSTLHYPLFAGSTFGAHAATGLVMDSVGYGIQLGGDSDYVANNVLTRVWNSGITPGSSQTTPLVSTVKGNSISCAGSEGPIGDAIALYNSRRYFVFADTIANCDRGILLNNVGAGTRVAGGRLLNNVTGIQVSQSDSSSVFVDSTKIAASYQAVDVEAGHVVVTRSRVENNITGLYVPFGADRGPYAIQAHLNSFVGNSSNAVLASDTVDASANWWGADAPPCVGTGNCANGRLDTTGYLPAEPAPLPATAPRMLASAARTRMVSTTQVQRNSASVRPEHRSKPAKVKAVVGRRPGAVGTSAARAAETQRKVERRSAAEARHATREQQRAAARAERTARSRLR